MHWALIFASLAIQSHTVFDWFCVSHAPQIELVRQCVALFRSSHFFELLSLDGALTYFFFSCSHEINKGISICVWPKGGQSLYAYLNCVSGACMFVCAIGIRQISRPSLIFSIRQWPMLIRRVHWKIICHGNGEIKKRERTMSSIQWNDFLPNCARFNRDHTRSARTKFCKHFIVPLFRRLIASIEQVH